jgi:DNA segregation ATPase FtsK/SpoIIIE, S-DNA-T family
MKRCPWTSLVRRNLKKELQGIGVGAVGLFMLLAFPHLQRCRSIAEQLVTEGGVRNLGGRLGAQMADLCLMLFGLASYLLPAALLFIAYNLLRFKEPRLRFYKVAAFCGLLFSCPRCLPSAWNQYPAVRSADTDRRPDWRGHGLPVSSKVSLNTFGALLVLLPLLAASIMILSGFSFVLFASWWLENLRTKWAARRERSAHAERYEQREKARNRRQTGSGNRSGDQGGITPITAPRPNFFKKEKRKEKAKDKLVQESFEFIKQEGEFVTPPLSLLDPPPATERRIDREALEMNARLLEKKLWITALTASGGDLPRSGDHHV